MAVCQGMVSPRWMFGRLIKGISDCVSDIGSSVRNLMVVQPCRFKSCQNQLRRRCVLVRYHVAVKRANWVGLVQMRCWSGMDVRWNRIDPLAMWHLAEVFADFAAVDSPAACWWATNLKKELLHSAVFSQVKIALQQSNTYCILLPITTIYLRGLKVS